MAVISQPETVRQIVSSLIALVVVPNSHNSRLPPSSKAGYDYFLMYINPTTTPTENFHELFPFKKLSWSTLLNFHFIICPFAFRWDNLWFNGRVNTSFMRAHSDKKAVLVPCASILPESAPRFHPSWCGFLISLEILYSPRNLGRFSILNPSHGS